MFYLVESDGNYSILVFSVGESIQHVVSLDLIRDSLHTDHGMVAQDGHHAVSVVDGFFFLVYRRKCYSAVLNCGDQVPLSQKFSQHVLVGPGGQRNEETVVSVIGDQGTLAFEGLVLVFETS